MARFSKKKLEDIVAEKTGRRRAVTRAEEAAGARDSLRPDADVGTPEVSSVQSKYLGAWQDIYRDSLPADAGPAPEPVERIDYEAGLGDDVEDEIVQAAVTDDESGPRKSFVVSGEEERVIGTQG